MDSGRNLWQTESVRGDSKDLRSV